jgi:type VI secretion system protein ImpC
MKLDLNFGRLKTTTRPGTGKPPGSFRIAVLGDFSGRANRGLIEVGDALAKRKPIKLDVDTLDGVIQKFQSVLHLPLGPEGGSVEIKPQALDDLHPDQLYENLAVFEELSTLRRQLDSTKTFAKAAAEVRDWLEERGKPVEPRPRRSRSTAIRIDAKLSDFAQLIGKPVPEFEEATAADELIKQVVAPHVVADDDPDQDALIAAVDQALSSAMRNLLHHPDFQALEAAWRSLDFLARRIETSTKLQIVIYDLSADELAADLSAAETLEDTGLYRLLVEQPALDAHQGPFSAFIGNYTFEMTPPHAELLGRMAQIAAQACAPFVAAIGTDCITHKRDDWHPLVLDAWDALRALPEAAFLGLATPRFLMRMPYGEKRETIDAFEFEEFNDKTGLRACLWGNPAILAAVLLAETFQQCGPKLQLGKVLALDDMPYFFYYDEDREATALPCTERLVSERVAAHIGSQNLIAVLAIKGRPEVRLAGFRSLAGTPLAGPWTPPESLPKRKPAPAAVQAAPEPVAVAPAPEPQPVAEPEVAAQTSAETDDDLDSLLSELTAASEPEPAPQAESSAEAAAETTESVDDELDALLAELGAAETAPPPAEEEMDPELAALLADL